MSFISTMMITLALVAPGQLGAVKSTVTDAAITTKVETTFLLNEHLSLFEINTDTDNGVVTLRGGVESEIQKELAEEIAASVSGVKQVNNELTVVPDVKQFGHKRDFMTKVEDRTITASVRMRLLKSDHLRGLKLQASTSNSVVTLTGLVRSEFQREKVEHITYQTKGVERVINQLVISPKEEVSGVKGAAYTVTDEILEKRIETSILLNPNISVRDIDVEVDDGVAYLTGVVNSQPESEVAATIAASTYGINKVTNRITIQGDPALPPATEKNTPIMLEPLDASVKVEPLEPKQPTQPTQPTPAPATTPGILEGDKPLF
jgi:osmotically-inducible protein OsmY